MKFSILKLHSFTDPFISWIMLLAETPPLKKTSSLIHITLQFIVIITESISSSHLYDQCT